MLHGNKKRIGFTLIELLVVIAIIAILAAILFPVFARAKAKARAITCLSNVKQLAVSVKMYQSDWDDYFPPIESHDRTMFVPGYRQYNWFYHSDYDGSSWLVMGTPGGLMCPYVQNYDIIVCPDWDQLPAVLPDGRQPPRAYHPSCSYGPNGFLGWHSDDCCGTQLVTWARAGERIKESTLQNIVHTIMLADMAYGAWGQFIYPPCTYTIYNTIGPRHMGNFNAAFCDGHARACDPATYFTFAPGECGNWDYL